MAIKTGLGAAFLACAMLAACAGDNPQRTQAYNDGYAAGCHIGNRSSVEVETPAIGADKSRYMTEGNFKLGWNLGNSLCYERKNGPGAG